MRADRAAAPRKRPRQQRSQETVQCILAAAARVFDARGYHATTTNHVAEVAGVSIGSLYQYFPNKDGLLVALAEQHVRDATAAFGDHLVELRRAAPPLPVVVRSLIALAVAQNDSAGLHTNPRPPTCRRQDFHPTSHL